MSDQRYRNKKGSYDFLSGKTKYFPKKGPPKHLDRSCIKDEFDSFSRFDAVRNSTSSKNTENQLPNFVALLTNEEMELPSQAGHQSQNESSTFSLFEDDYKREHGQSQLPDFKTLLLDDDYFEAQSLSDEGVQSHTESLSKVSERRGRSAYFGITGKTPSDYKSLYLEEEYLPTIEHYLYKRKLKPRPSLKSELLPECLSRKTSMSRSQSQDRAGNKEEEHILAEDIRKLKEKHPLAQFVVCRTSETFAKKIVIGYNSSLKRDEKFRMNKSGVEVVFKNPYMTSNEAVFVNNERFMKGRMSYDFNILTYLKVCIDEHASDLWKKHSNLTIITGDYFKCTGGVSSPDPCIVFYCLSKGFIPINEELFPRELACRMGTLKTDVREGYFTLGPSTMRGYPDSFNDPICMGSNIGNQYRDASGSLGLFVDLPHNGKGFLTCCHVLFDCVKPREFSYSHIYDSEVQHVIQPGKSAFCSNTDTACGEILQAKFCPGRSPVSVDAALVKVNRRIPLTGHFVIKTVPQVKEIGYDLEALPVFDTGRVRRKISKHDLEKPLLKSGTSSGLTRSLFRLNGAQVRIIEEGAWLGMDEQLPITMKGQYEVESGSKEPGSLNKPFFIPGDSGSAVFAKENDGTLTCIGIAIGITSYGTTVVTPIGAVLDALNLKDTDVTKFS